MSVAVLPGLEFLSGSRNILSLARSWKPESRQDQGTAAGHGETLGTSVWTVPGRSTGKGSCSKAGVGPCSQDVRDVCWFGQTRAGLEFPGKQKAAVLV